MSRQLQLESINQLLRIMIWQGHKQAVDTMERLGLTVPQASVLFSLEAYQGQSTMSDLAKQSQLSPATMTGIVDRLITAGWVERIRDDIDRRVVLVRLTTAGQTKVEAIHAERMQNMSELTSSFTIEELAQFQNFLQRLLDYMGQ